MSQKATRCARCNRFSPLGKITYVRGVPLGPECYKTLSHREKIRTGGPNPRVVNSEDSGMFGTSDFGILCPDDLHCFQCIFFTETKCPTEVKFGALFE